MRPADSSRDLPECTRQSADGDVGCDSAGVEQKSQEIQHPSGRGVRRDDSGRADRDIRTAHSGTVRASEKGREEDEAEIAREGNAMVQEDRSSSGSGRSRSVRWLAHDLVLRFLDVPKLPVTDRPEKNAPSRESHEERHEK